MSYADFVYNQLIYDILEDGVWENPENVRPKYAGDGAPATYKSLTGVRMQFNSNEVPILTTKEVPQKDPIEELFWIWQDKSNKIEDLQKRGCKVWNAWEIKDGPWAGTIGPAYGYQLGRKCYKVDGVLMDQVDYVLHCLKHDRASRGIITTLWDITQLDQMALRPCVWSTQWIVKQGKLDLIVQIRSNDMALGNPYNIYQYGILQRLFAQVSDLEVGKLIFNIGDAHIYDRHEDGLRKQICERPYPAPELWINPEIKNFYDFTTNDIKLINYQHGKKYKYEIAI